MGSHSVTCHPAQVNAPRLIPVMQAGTRFTYPRGMEGWIDLGDLIAPWPRVEIVTLRSRVRHLTTAPQRLIYNQHLLPAAATHWLQSASSLLSTIVGVRKDISLILVLPNLRFKAIQFTHKLIQIDSLSQKVGPFDLTTACLTLYAKLVNSGCLYSLRWNHRLRIIS